MGSKQRTYNGMSYRDVQRANSENRLQLKLADQQWLKQNNYRNVGWDNVIRLYETINDFLEKYRFEELPLEELFLEADRIGNKYLSPEEIEDSHQKLAKEVNQICEQIDQQFPDTEVEIIDFSKPAKPSSRKPRKR
ncbi:hypothetical protein [Leptolyngbya sp. NK1-12]|uniref:hypothetical protein n=1 Tax=Leptolyngbya sp. NK1-12 TaxID=2547451 RepID=UPI00292CAAC3|nr:hypothetical protein [Leptolyngbya sp. NK1-12]